MQGKPGDVYLKLFLNVAGLGFEEPMKGNLTVEEDLFENTDMFLGWIGDPTLKRLSRVKV
jgi:hypothetical protein